MCAIIHALTLWWLFLLGKYFKIYTRLGFESSQFRAGSISARNFRVRITILMYRVELESNRAGNRLSSNRVRARGLSSSNQARARGVGIESSSSQGSVELESSSSQLEIMQGILSTHPFVNASFRQRIPSSTHPFVNASFRQRIPSSTHPFVNASMARRFVQASMARRFMPASRFYSKA